jgi:hypothetical protein
MVLEGLGENRLFQCLEEKNTKNCKVEILVQVWPYFLNLVDLCHREYSSRDNRS